MTSFVQVNFFTTTISAAITSSDTSLSLGSTTGAPTIPSGSAWPLILTANDIYEVVYVTALSGSTATVERAQEGTTAQAWASGTTIYGAFTAGAVLYDGDSMTADNLTVTGTTTLQSNVTADNLTVTGTTTLQSNVTADNLTVTGTTTLQSNVTADNLTVTGTTTLQSNVTVDAPTSGPALTVNGLAADNGGINLIDNNAANAVATPFYIRRYGSTANAEQQGPNILLEDTSAPTSSLLQHSGGQTEIWQDNGGWKQLAFWNTNRGLTLNAPASGDALTVNGTVYASDFNSPSDANLKTDIRPIENAREIAKKIRGIYFRWISNGKESAGVLAQEVQKVFPQAVRVRPDGTLSVDPMALIGLLFATIE